MIDYKYDVALSFAGEQRNYVEQVALQLRDWGFSVFYDGFPEAQIELWGQNLIKQFFKIYKVQARYCVAFISKNYASKDWTNHEYESILERVFSQKDTPYLLPVRFDNAILSGHKEALSYIDANVHTPLQLAEMIKKKLAHSQ